MGAVADKYCDTIYLTDDNPRLENPNLIRNQIKKGIKDKDFFEIPSRAKAILKAINDLKSGDVLIVAGKGHENYQEYKQKKFFCDRTHILKAIKIKNLSLSSSLKTNILLENFKKNYLNKNIHINSASMFMQKMQLKMVLY